jgi:hypothetical protein
VRLHSAIGYIAPADKLAGKEDAIFAARDQKLLQARETRKAKRNQNNNTHSLAATQLFPIDAEPVQALLPPVTRARLERSRSVLDIGCIPNSFALWQWAEK